MAAIKLEGLDEQIADRIVELIIPRLQLEIERLNKPDRQLTLTELLDKKLNCSYSLYREKYKATIPHTGSGKSLRFSEIAVDEWMRKRQITLM